MHSELLSVLQKTITEKKFKNSTRLMENININMFHSYDFQFKKKEFIQKQHDAHSCVLQVFV